MAQTNETPGFVYLLHFFGKIGNASHYTGFAEDVDKRIKQHESGRASKFTSEMKSRGFKFLLARTWEGPKKLEREIKKLRNGPGLCPICLALKHKRKEGDAKMVLFPAMGRDYKTVKEATEAWDNDKSFVVGGPGGGYYTTQSEVRSDTDLDEVTILFNNRKSIATFAIYREEEPISIAECAVDTGAGQDNAEIDFVGGISPPPG